MLRLTFFITVAVGLLVAGCTASEPPAAEEPLPPPEDVVSAVGTVRYVDLEGGFYGIVVEQGIDPVNEGLTRYLPLNLGAEYREDGLEVRFRGVLIDSVATAQIWGRVIEIRDITRLE